jgi:hypothetical protein
LFRKLGRRFRSLLTRDYHLEEELEVAAREGRPFTLEFEHFYDQLEAITASLEEAKTAALGQDWKEAGQGLLDHFHDRLRPQSLCDHHQADELASALRAAHPQDCRRWLKAAEAALAHRYSPLQGEEHSFPHSIDWYCDFVGGSWMLAPSLQMSDFLAQQSLSLEQQEGLRRTYSFNQLGHLVDLGRSFWLSGKEAYASECIVQAVDWAERNPVFMGINWSHPKVVAARTLNWYVMVCHLLASNLMQGELLARLLKVLVLHLGYLVLHLRSQRGYRLTCAASLYLVTSHLPELTPAKKWQTLARQHLSLAIEEEFASEGLHCSGNLSLHREATDYLVLVCLFDLLNSRTQAEIQNVTLGALEALTYLKPPAGHQGELGASLTEGLLGRNVGPNEHSQRLLAMGSLLFQRSDLSPGGELPAELWWWLGPEVAMRNRSQERHDPRGTRRLFSTAQIAVVRDQWGPRSTWCQLRGYGPRWQRHEEGAACDPEPLPLPQHDDALSLALSLEGEPFLLEPGAPLIGGALGACFSRIGAHSAVRIGREMEPLDMTPPVQETPRLRLESCKDGHYLVGQRPVWFDLEQPFWLTREVLFLPKKQRIVVRDTLDGEGEIHLETNLLLAPHLDILMRGDMGSLLRGRKLQARILPLFPTRFRYEVLKGKSEGLQGFFWSEAGRAVPTHLLRYFARVTLPATVSLWIAWNPEDTLTPRPQDVEKLFKNR